MSDIDNFVYWDALRWNKETSYYYKLIDIWKSMLENTQLREQDYLNFLSRNAGFFFHDGNNTLISISELELGADYRVDFVVCHDRLSYGFEYEFIEIESPTDAVYTKKGLPSAHLIEAYYGQIKKWRLWLDANRAEAKRILPSKSFVYFDAPYFKYTIIIARRKETENFIHLRNEFGKDKDIEIRSFDYLTDKLLARHFNVTPSIQSEDFKQLDFRIKNDLANPFAEAFKSAVWRKMAKSNILCDSHMIAKNAKILLSNRNLNDEINRFLDSWVSVKLTERQRLLKDAKMYNL